MNTRNIVISLIFIAVTAGVLWAMQTFKPKPTVRDGNTVARIPVEIVAMEPADYLVRLPSQGLVEAITRAELATQVAGTVVAKSPSFDIGGAFKAGDVLLTIDDADYISARRLAHSNLKQAKVNFEQEQARAEQAVRDWARLGNGKPPSDLVQRKPQLAAAQAQLDAAQAQLEKADLDLSRTTIVAPFNGRVLDEKVDVGSYVNRSQSIGTIVESDRWQVRLPISASWRQMLDWSGEQSAVEFSLLVDDHAVRWQGEIQRISAEVSAGSRQFTVIATIDLQSASDLETALFIGDYLTAHISGKQLHEVFTVPRAAVYDDSFVWLYKDDAVYKQNVNVAWTDDTHAIIDQGLIDGDVVVITPLSNKTISGTAVRVIERPQSALEQGEQLSAVAIPTAEGS